MSYATRTLTRLAVAVAASGALLLGTAMTPPPAAASVVTGIDYLSPGSSDLAERFPDVASALWLLAAVPVIGSSILSSVIGVPQCGLHDTRGCSTGQ
ncbi:MAG: hypothetical protein Q4F37_00140 [Corynebacterium sp.]|uniref:hypothetical protein n=1 Tax=Corynebacterium sp. TaxID=1720 RepID=UPI0026FC15B0|nr:hypothetical protein [Corynebacterium sp.]